MVPSAPHPDSHRLSSTLLGVLAILFWSSVIAVSRHLMVETGILTSACVTYLSAGTLGCVYLLITRRLQRVAHLGFRYLTICGGLLAAYTILLYLALGLSVSSEQTIEVGVINYLWPGMTLVLSIPILRRRARATLILGVLVALAGVVLAAHSGSTLSLESFCRSAQGNYLPYWLALGAAICWALFSNFSNRLAAGTGNTAVPIFLLAIGVLLAAALLVFPEKPATWSVPAIGELLYMVVFPTLLGYVFWDRAMRRGNLTLVVSLSYLTPLLSTLVSCIYLRVTPTATLWIACILVAGGAAICHWSMLPAITRPKKPAAQ